MLLAELAAVIQVFLAADWWIIETKHNAALLLGWNTSGWTHSKTAQGFFTSATLQCFCSGLFTACAFIHLTSNYWVIEETQERLSKSHSDWILTE